MNFLRALSEAYIMNILTFIVVYESRSIFIGF